MKVCVVGAGAIGSFIGADLSLRSCQVAALARGATAASLRAHGFRLEQAGALVTAPVRVVEDGAPLGAQDLVVLAVKGPSLRGVAEKVTPMLGSDTMVLTAVTEIGETVGVPTPNTDALLGLVRVFEEAHHG